jgi:hypothetical protein
MNLFRASLVSKGAVPIVFYFICFCLLTFPLILHFNTHFYTDTGDGLQNIWNIWWVNKAVTDLHQSPWSTTLLHFPQGTSLLAHTLNPFNGFICVGLLPFMTLTQAYNFMVLFSFVFGGWMAFLLAFHLSRSYWGSLMAGFIFTFSNYHFSHAEGHMQLVSLEWIPLFLLCWLLFLKRPTVVKGLAASAALSAVLLCDYYYFFFCILAGGLIFIWFTIRKSDAFFLLRKKSIGPFGAFVGGCLLTCAPLVVALMLFNSRHTLLGVHDADVFSLDLLAPLIPGGHWRFESLTRFYWTRLPGNFHESSVHIGLSVIIVLVLTWAARKKIRIKGLGLWYLLTLFFLILSLGPVLHIWGKEISWIKLPYLLLEWIFPPLRLGGMPIRMMVMVTLCAGVLFAMGFQKIFVENLKRRRYVFLLLALLVFEYLPRPMPLTRVEVPAYVEALKNLPGNKGVIDMAAELPPFALYYQTIHEKPIAEGYIARFTEEVDRQDGRIRQLLAQGDFEKLYRSYHFQYLATGGEINITPAIPLKKVFDDGRVRIYDLGAAWE